MKNKRRFVWYMMYRRFYWFRYGIENSETFIRSLNIYLRIKKEDEE